MDLPIPDSNLQPSSHKSNALPTELSGLPKIASEWYHFFKSTHSLIICIIQFRILFICTYCLSTAYAHSQSSVPSFTRASRQNSVDLCDMWACLVEGFNTLATAGVLNLPDKRVDPGCWLRSGFESPWRQLGF